MLTVTTIHPAFCSPIPTTCTLSVPSSPSRTRRSRSSPAPVSTPASKPFTSLPSFRRLPSPCTSPSLPPAPTPTKRTSKKKNKQTTTERKPHGYWNEETNLITELRLFLYQLEQEQVDMIDVMPTISDLRHANRHDLIKAIHQHGGFTTIASKLGLKTARTSSKIIRSERYKQETYEELRRVCESLYTQGYIDDMGCMPTSTLLKQLGYKSLYNRIVFLGGFMKVAGELGLKSKVKKSPEKRKRKYYWNDWFHVEKEIQHFSTMYTNGCMPSQKDLIQHNRFDLLNAIRYHGGLVNVCKLAKLQYSSESSSSSSSSSMQSQPQKRRRKYKNYWYDSSILHGELRTYTLQNGYPGLMPNKQQLVNSNRKDLIYAIEKFGGFNNVAQNMHLVWHGPRSFWRKFSNLKKRLLSFISKQFPSQEQQMPTIQYLYKHKRLDLIYGIMIHGGCMKVANRIGIPIMKSKTYSHKMYWEMNYRYVKKDLQNLIEIQPLECRKYMPSSILLVQLGRFDLATKIRDHGGWLYYAQILGLRFSYDDDIRLGKTSNHRIKFFGFWQNESNVVNELLHYIDERYGNWELPGTIDRNEYDENTIYIPSSEMLKRDGRSDIAFAIERFHGGIDKLCEKHGWIVAKDVVEYKPIEQLNIWNKYQSSLQGFIQLHGSYGIMPTKQQLITNGRHDLRYATIRHGGFNVVSKRMQLCIVDNQHKCSSGRGGGEWIGDWLGLQCGKMGVYLQLCERNVHNRLRNELEKELSSNGVGRVKNELQCKDVDVDGEMSKKQRYNYSSGRHNSGNSTKLSPTDLQILRDKYSHLPPDDIIAV